jgi:hypothetical protein
MAIYLDNHSYNRSYSLHKCTTSLLTVTGPLLSGAFFSVPRLLFRVRVTDTSRLAVYHQSVRLDAEPLETHGQTSLFVASYDSQGYGGGIQPRIHTGTSLVLDI